MAATQLAERAPRVRATPDINEYNKYEASCRHRAWVEAQWRLAPHVIAHEGCGEYVLLDASLRAIVRVFADERTEFLEPDAEYGCDDGLEYIYQGYAYPPTKLGQALIIGHIVTFKLHSELQRRRELLRRGEFAGGRGH